MKMHMNSPLMLCFPLGRQIVEYFDAQEIYFSTLSEKKVQKLSLGRYLFKGYTFVPKGCILIP